LEAARVNHEELKDHSTGKSSNIFEFTRQEFLENSEKNLIDPKDAILHLHLARKRTLAMVGLQTDRTKGIANVIRRVHFEGH
jgi:hypothetical protein